jgi:hypothetical protein
LSAFGTLVDRATPERPCGRNIANTHGLLRPEVFQAFEGWTTSSTPATWARPRCSPNFGMAPVTAVTEYGRLRPPRMLPQVVTMELDGFTIVVTHGDQSAHRRRRSCTPPSAGRVIVFGHTHRPLLTLVDWWSPS